MFRRARSSGRSPIRSSLYLRAIVAALALAATSAMAAPRPHLRVALGWLPQADFAGFFAAQANGLYDRAGLDVEIVPGNARNGAVMMLATGAYDFVNVFNSGVALDMANVHLPYIAIAAIYQKEPTAIIVHDGPDAPRSLVDLRGYPIMISPEALDNYWAFLVGRFGYTSSQVRRYTGDSTLFIATPHIAQQGYLTNDVARLHAAGVPIRVFPLADAGYSSYGPIIVARRALVDQHPEIVQRFLDATLQGWCLYLHGDRTGTDRLIMAGNPDYTEQNASDAVAAMRQYQLIEGGDARTQGIGIMTAARWNAYFQQMQPTGLYPPHMDFSTLYTTRFLHHMTCDSGQ
ncbi:ABC transporter substrate-binding protein [Gluconacetobacter liquefaciens]|nr:ABC transporter substrate-binding protein [Gluconacetobacter liquefaciens]RDI36832.1 NitT/TauT family transport system substrate-binding protein [Gluconacetobacter liquefaciens]GEB39338.1 ABC transporter substrate-binding protein [Gluconacetobacter liquefaciens]